MPGDSCQRPRVRIPSPTPSARNGPGGRAEGWPRFYDTILLLRHDINIIKDVDKDYNILYRVVFLGLMTTFSLICRFEFYLLPETLISLWLT